MIKKFYTYTKESIHSEIDPYGEENWNEIDFKKLFIDFLKEKEVYEKYIQYLNRGGFGIDNIDDMFNEMPPHRWLRNAFSWVNTKENFAYWARIDTKWVNILFENGYENDD